LPSGAAATILAGVDARALVKWVEAELRALYGEVDLARQEPLETLVATILSQNTTDTNSGRAYASLLERFETLERVRKAPVEAIEEAIRIGGLQHEKALAIKGVLERIVRERRTLDLSFLETLALGEARAWLLASPGVGDKTAGIVLLFAFGKPYFPADTHVRRVTVRLGLVGPKEDLHRRLNALLPKDPDFMASLHLHLVRHGRETCHARAPDCGGCVLCARCAWRKETAG